jgi:hypothetical protein
MPVTRAEKEPLYPPDLVPAVLALPWREYEAKTKPKAVGRDGFPVFYSDPLCEIQLLLNQYLDEAAEDDRNYYKLKPHTLPSGKQLLKRDANWRGQVVMAAAARVVWFWKAGRKWSDGLRCWVYRDEEHRDPLIPLLAVLLNGEPQLTENEVFDLIELQTGPMSGDIRDHILPLGVVMAVERCFAGRTVPLERRGPLTKWLRILQSIQPSEKNSKWDAKIASHFPSGCPELVQLDNLGEAFRRLAGLIGDDEILLELSREVRANFSLGGLGALLDLLGKKPLTPQIKQELDAVKQLIEGENLAMGDSAIWLPQLLRSREGQQLVGRLRALVGGVGTGEIEPGEAWANAARENLDALPAAKRSAWDAFIGHCTTAQPSKPAKKWLAKAAELIAAIGIDQFKQAVIKWFPLVALPRPEHRENPAPRYQPDPDLLITDRNAIILKGLAWSCAGMNDPAVSRALSELAEICFKKVRNLGPRCPKAGNACLHALSVTTTDASAAQLSRLSATVKQPTAKKRIGKSIVTAATLTGQTKEDLEEKATPTFGLDGNSRLTRSFGDCAVELRITDAHTIEINWTKGGIAKKAVPAEVKRDHAADLKQFQQLAKDIQKMLSAHRVRIERLLMSERTWHFDSWRQRYLDHPLLAPMTRPLIWQFQQGDRTTLGIWHQEKLVDIQDRPLGRLGGDARVRLWHPIGAEVATVAAWRRWLENHEVCQPFKQAHREVYIITDAELATGTYSNRFARHIIRQHQFVALTNQRGWKYSFMGSFDFQSTPTLELPAWGLNAEFWVEPMGAGAGTGVSLYLSTDQIRFTKDGEAVPLRDVPPLVFSEVMRDVDLFVGVGSIGNDPAWRDTEGIEGAGDYWQTFSFGQLSAAAQTRHDVLERLLPKLKIAAQCELKDKFLHVRGTLRTYKIHLGSGNILMEPNDQYLCIVGNQRLERERKMFLPFEGDRTLSLILSKAFLLAEDSKINDQSILNQIGPLQ